MGEELWERIVKLNYIDKYFREAEEIIEKIDRRQVGKVISLLREVRGKKGRIFFLGVGGGAANASHAVNDLRKICGIEAYAPMDNVAELTARVNDDGWETVFVNWLAQSRLNGNDGIFVFSVGGGNLEKNISANLVRAVEYAKKMKAKILGVVGRDGGFTALKADACVVIPSVNPKTVTPHTESFQAVIWHLLVSHPGMMKREMKWESIKP